MANSPIRLVYSSTSSKKVADERVKWGYENAKQLSLFDDFNSLRIIFLPVAEISAHSFMKALEENSPDLVLDTRDFPDFFSVFVSTTSALDEFHRRGIKYSRISINSHSSIDEYAWKRLDTFKSLLVSHLNENTNAPIFILASTRNNLHKISDKLKGYIAQEIVEAKFEEIRG